MKYYYLHLKQFQFIDSMLIDQVRYRTQSIWVLSKYFFAESSP